MNFGMGKCRFIERRHVEKPSTARVYGRASSTQTCPKLQVLGGHLPHFTMQHFPFPAQDHREGQASGQIAQRPPQIRAAQTG